MSEREYPDKAEALGARGRPRAAHGTGANEGASPSPLGVLHRLHLAHEADPSKLEEWRRATDGSQEDAWAEDYDEAMGVLARELH